MLKCVEMNPGARGTGGRVADDLAVKNRKFCAMSLLLTSTSIWPLGSGSRREIADNRVGTCQFQEYEWWRIAVVNATGKRDGTACQSKY